jgi:hypothetical protein
MEDFENANGRGREKLRKLWHNVKKYNPSLALARNGALLGIKINIFGLASRLYPAMISESDAKSKKIKVSAIAKAKPSLEKARKFWEKMGGKPSAIENAIKKGARHRITKMNKTSGVDGETEIEFLSEDFSNFEPVTTGAAITAGMTLLTAILHMVNKSGAEKNPFEGESGDQFDKDNVDSPEGTTDEKALADLAAKAEADKAAGLPLDDDGEGNKKLIYIGIGVAALALIGGAIWYFKRKK